MARNVLLVDDSNTVKAVIARSLAMSGLAVDALFMAGDGREGLEMMRRETVHLVIADINMPVMGGAAFLRKPFQPVDLKRAVEGILGGENA